LVRQQPEGCRCRRIRHPQRRARGIRAGGDHRLDYIMQIDCRRNTACCSINRSLAILALIDKENAE
jgi:hypothetical protein